MDVVPNLPHLSKLTIFLSRLRDTSPPNVLQVCELRDIFAVVFCGSMRLILNNPRHGTVMVNASATITPDALHYFDRSKPMRLTLVGNLACDGMPRNKGYFGLDRIRTSADHGAYTLQVFRAPDLSVVAGANLGDTLMPPAEMVLADVYKLRSGAHPTRLTLVADPETAGAFSVAESSVVGTAHCKISISASATFMDEDGTTIEALILVETSDGATVAVYMSPLAPLRQRQEYSLVKLDTKKRNAHFNDLACVSFARGTHVLLADGTQTMIETLRPGDSVMTRDHGPQTIRWIGHQTVRAEGEFAPIVLKKGALNNASDLTLGPNHRLFLYQRSDPNGFGASEITVRAKLLVNGETIIRSKGGFIEYCQVLFDRHEIIYVEGIAAESMFVDANSTPALPNSIGSTRSHHNHRKPKTYALDLQAKDLRVKNAANILRNASAG